jgi:UDP-glucose 4-epimerase
VSATVLITGVAGFLGRYVAQHFENAGWSVIGVDQMPVENVQLPLVRYQRLQLPGAGLAELLQAEAPQACIHCAGCASVGFSLEDPAADFRGNTLLVFEVLEALRHHAPECRFVLLSSAAVYGDPATLPVTEQHALRPLSPYGYHKRQAELLCEEFARIYSLRTASLRIFSAYGAGLRRQVIWDISRRALNGGPLILQGTGAESRDFIHASDVARACWAAANFAPMTGEVYNAASGRETAISELAEIVLRALGLKNEIKFDGVLPSGTPKNWRADIAKLTSLGFAPLVEPRSGIGDFAAWCRTELTQETMR